MTHSTVVYLRGYAVHVVAVYFKFMRTHRIRQLCISVKSGVIMIGLLFLSVHCYYRLMMTSIYGTNV